MSDESEFELKGEITAASLLSLKDPPLIRRLSISRAPVFTVHHAQLLEALPPIEWLWLWCDVTRPALNRILHLRGLQKLDVLRLRLARALRGFDRATHLLEFRANLCLTESDLLAAARAPALQELGAQSSNLTPAALRALTAMPGLQRLNLEATGFDDRMAKRLARCADLRSLDLGGSRLTGRGLAALTSLRDLEALDLWATQICETDLPLLRHFPRLNYLSLGNYDHLPSMDPEQVTELILSLPAIERVWLDGIALNADQTCALEARLMHLRRT